MEPVTSEKIDSREALQATAYTWAVTRNLDPVFYREVAETMFFDIDERSTYRHIIETSLLHFEGRRSELIRIYERGEWIGAETANTWSVETAKHLFLVNAAGLAGAIALYTREGIDEFTMICAVTVFAFGIVLVLLAMWAALKSSLALTQMHTAALKSIRRASSWKRLGSFFNWVAKNKEKAMKCYDSANTILGWASGILAVIGFVLMAKALF